jgi:hypothetical protein
MEKELPKKRKRKKIKILKPKKKKSPQTPPLLNQKTKNQPMNNNKKLSIKK